MSVLWYPYHVCLKLEREMCSIYPALLAVSGGAGGTPLYKPCRYVPTQRVGFFLKTGIDFAHFGLESCMKELQLCLNVFVLSIPNE